MLQRVAILVLVSVVMGAGVTTCRPVSACAMSLHARQSCCNHGALQMSRCCCAARQRPAQLVSTAGPMQQDHGSMPQLAVPGWQPSITESGALTAHRIRAGYGPAPPGTPTQNHIQLLL